MIVSYIHSFSHPYTQICLNLSVDDCVINTFIRSPIHTDMLSFIHTYMYANRKKHTRTHTHVYIHVNMRTSRIHTYIFAHTHAHDIRSQNESECNVKTKKIHAQPIVHGVGMHSARHSAMTRREFIPTDIETHRCTGRISGTHLSVHARCICEAVCTSVRLFLCLHAI